ncbi:AMP-binding protein [Sulfitobacter sp. M57]|uniref:AMP-binding protein n=1 Tax=unclassified Sulfitobacter TaxID=196795 RepID=UPI0023E25599|nr:MULTISPECIES: AMP-binding protein [unclassified Sulfitobacter]MDF3415867.1 AMP-binding protein [Sulfitobacter sp. KE5]MDF3423347.1 AMP-binding protein [Sulfitobacter sp. KE43]MDF3434413.1 AMP-binding protein [Sulfitobacter sp. KE42]MDF3460053.1 AMP-binding protein [Sulfitobacter sp. S74]MDF3463951.1 AMP-binding protein [Sulfitobacter sp. Ks18]
MIAPATFHLHPNAGVLDPQAAGMQALLSCLNKGLPIESGYCNDTPIRQGTGQQQWLDCQTSGSTGAPKTIRRSPASWQASFERAGDLFGLGPADHYAVLGALGHSLSLFAVLEALHIGASLSVLSEMFPKAQVQALQRRAVTALYATPTQLKQLIAAAPPAGVISLPAVQHILVGGGKLLTTDRTRLRSFFPSAQIAEFYGTSETSFITLARHDIPAGSVGRPYPGVEIDIAVTDQTQGYGEVRVRSPYLAQGYVGANTPSILQPDGFVTTGEIGYLDCDGFLFLKGRSDRMFTVSDVNVYPEAIENAVASLETVTACAVVPIPDGNRGNRAVCFVKPATQGCTPAAIRLQCRATLGEAHVPREVRIITDFPMLPSGKPDLVALKIMLEAKA